MRNVLGPNACVLRMGSDPVPQTIGLCRIGHLMGVRCVWSVLPGGTFHPGRWGPRTPNQFEMRCRITIVIVRIAIILLIRIDPGVMIGLYGSFDQFDRVMIVLQGRIKVLQGKIIDDIVKGIRRHGEITRMNGNPGQRISQSRHAKEQFQNRLLGGIRQSLYVQGGGFRKGPAKS